MAIKLYSGPLSLFSKKVEIALGEKGLAFERVIVPFTQLAGYSPKHPVVAEANPKGQVPVLIDGDLVLYDSTVIIEYLEDAYPSVPLWPSDPIARARARLLELFADEIMMVPLRSLMHRTEPGPDDSGRKAVKRPGKGTLHRRRIGTPLGALLRERPPGGAGRGCAAGRSR